MLTSVGDDIELYEFAYTHLRKPRVFIIILDKEAIVNLYEAMMYGNIKEMDCFKKVIATWRNKVQEKWRASK